LPIDDWDELDTEWEPGPSKSQVKRELLALQELGARLLALPPGVLARVPLGDEVRAAIEEARRIKAHGARRRQVRYIGKLLRDEDAGAIERAVAGANGEAEAQKRRLRVLEDWRERLLREGDPALSRLIEEYPRADRQHLRLLVRTALREEEQGKPPAAARKLFRYLRELD